MAVADISESYLRVQRGENSRLVWAFVISLLIHFLMFGTYKAGQEFGWWINLQWPSWLQKPKLLTELLKKESHQPPPEREIPLMFVDVSSAQATPEPPKDAKYYSARNSIAANPEPDSVANVPEITGQQTEIVRTEDVPRERATPLQPTPPPPVEEPKPAEEQLKAKPPEPPGDLALAKPDPPKPPAEPGVDIQSRPRRLTEVARVTPPKMLPGQKMKQEGGVRRRLEVTSLDAKATEVGIYDSALVWAVQRSWYLLLDEQHYASDYRGKVVLQFRLHHDGNVTDLRVVENSAGPIPGLICETAVDRPKPFDPFPPHMRRMVGDTREIQFTFFYN